MIQIILEQLQFYSYHGLYPEERILGSNYMVDIHLLYQPDREIIQALDQTIDYSIIYELISQRMKVPTELLETIATEFCHQLMEKFASIQTIHFTIKKLNPPIAKFTGNVGISLQLNRTDL
jgi:dihydroneopterin aldolase